MEDMNSNKPQLIVLNPSPEEQVFSNPLLVDIIWVHFATQDLIRISLVNRAWFTKSRELLTASNSQHAICIQMDFHSPCRTLLKFNAFLEDRAQDPTNNIPLIFNGIRLMYDNSSPHYQFHNCHDCLKYNWIVKGIGRETQLNVANEQLVMDKLPEMFGNILHQINFKHFRIHDRLSFHCPFACLIKWYFRRKPEIILEIGLGIDHIVDDGVDRKYLFKNISSTTRFPTFPNLKILGMYYLPITGQGERLPVVAPALKAITLFAYMRMAAELIPDFPRFAITNLKISTQTLRTAVEFLEKFHSKIQTLDIWEDSELKLKTKKDLYQLGRLVSTTLKNLTCTAHILRFMVCSTEESANANKRRYRFPELETLGLRCSFDGDALSNFDSIDVPNDFPELDTVRVELFDVSTVYESPAHGSNDGLIGAGMFRRIRNLSLETKLLNTYSKDWESYWLNSFNNIGHLDLTGMPFKYDRNDQLFANFLRKIDNLRFVKILSIRSNNLNFFCLDHLFTLNIPEIRKGLEGLNLQHLLVYQSSLLGHSSLEQITIHGMKNCTEFINKERKSRCCSRQKSGTFLVSKSIAEIICQHRPGFKFCLKITGACIPECTSGFQPGGLRLDHLEPFAKIRTVQAPGVKFQRFWEIEFLKTK